MYLNYIEKLKIQEHRYLSFVALFSRTLPNFYCCCFYHLVMDDHGTIVHKRIEKNLRMDLQMYPLLLSDIGKSYLNQCLSSNEGSDGIIQRNGISDTASYHKLYNMNMVPLSSECTLQFQT